MGGYTLRCLHFPLSALAPACTFIHAHKHAYTYTHTHRCTPACTYPCQVLNAEGEFWLFGRQAEAIPTSMNVGEKVCHGGTTSMNVGEKVCHGGTARRGWAASHAGCPIAMIGSGAPPTFWAETQLQSPEALRPQPMSHGPNKLEPFWHSVKA